MTVFDGSLTSAASEAIVLLVPEQALHAVRRLSILDSRMQFVPAGFKVPLKVDIKTGRTWADCK
jgi:DNA polymerase I-like protein with 3'-5' exonuclease and polymerase domains